MSNILGELTLLFQEYFDDESIILSTQTTSDDIAEWDSLAQVGLILSIEKKFGIKLSGRDVEGLANVGGMIDVIRAKKQ